MVGELKEPRRQHTVIDSLSRDPTLEKLERERAEEIETYVPCAFLMFTLSPQ